MTQENKPEQQCTLPNCDCEIVHGGEGTSYAVCKHTMKQPQQEVHIKAESAQWLMDKLEERHSRYIEAEECLMQLLEMPWWKFILFGKKRAWQHLLNTLNKYKF